MATKKKDDEDNGADAPEATEDQAAAAGDAGDALGTEDGYVGTKTDPRDNSEYSLESGPDSPSALEGAITAKQQEAEALERSND